MVKRLLWIGVPLVALGALWFFSRRTVVAVDVGEVTRGEIRSFVEEEARTRVRERYVVSAPVSGRLARIELEEGDAVSAGAAVARIDPLPLRAAVDEVKARIRALQERKAGVPEKRPEPAEVEHARLLVQQAEEALIVAQRELERAKAEWSRLEKDLDRAQALARQQLVPVADLDAAVAAEAEAHEHVNAQEVRVRIAQLAISAARLKREVLESRLDDFAWEENAYDDEIAALGASLASLEDDLAQTEVHAPSDGVVLRRFQESQQVVSAGTPILEIGDVTDLEVEADFLSEDAAHMQKDMPAEVFGRALGDRVIPARVSRIHPSAFEDVSSLGVEQQRVTVVVTPEAPVAGLGDRYRVEVRVILDARQDVVLVPESALWRLQDASCVFVVDGDVARQRSVATGLRDGRRREVKEGLRPGERVILHPGDAVSDGQRIRVLGAGE